MDNLGKEAYHMEEEQKDTLLSRKEAAEILRISPRTLAKWACKEGKYTQKVGGGYGLPFIKVGRLSKYRLSELEAWLESRTRNI